MLQKRCSRLAGAGLLCSVMAVAGEYAVLQTGYRIRVERHEAAGETVRLHTPGGGVIELPAGAVATFERDDDLPPPPEQPPTPRDPQPLSVEEIIRQAAGEHSLPAELIESVVAAESAYDPRALSPKGAMGLMQLMPETAAELQVRDPWDPSENVRGGAAYLVWLLHRYAGERDQLVRALAAYNAGPGRVEQYGGLPPFDETRAFVRRVIERFVKSAEK